MSSTSYSIEHVSSPSSLSVRCTNSAEMTISPPYIVPYGANNNKSDLKTQKAAIPTLVLPSRGERNESTAFKTRTLRIPKKCDEMSDLCELAEKFFMGSRFTQDTEKAIETFKLAADNGSIHALVRLGDIFFDIGNGDKGNAKDFQEAFIYYQRAIEKGSITAMEKVGYCYLHGKGVQANIQKGLSILNEVEARNAVARDTADKKSGFPNKFAE